MSNIFPKRGEIWIVRLDPAKGSEIKKTRSCLVVSRDEYNQLADTVTVIPLSSGEPHYPTWQVKVGKSAGLKEISHLLIPQIRVATKKRFQKRIGKISDSVWPELEEKLMFYLKVEFLSPRLEIITAGSFWRRLGGSS